MATKLKKDGVNIEINIGQTDPMMGAMLIAAKKCGMDKMGKKKRDSEMEMEGPEMESEMEMEEEEEGGMGGTNLGLDRSRYYSYDERSGSAPTNISGTYFQRPQDTTTQEQFLASMMAREGDALARARSSLMQTKQPDVMTSVVGTMGASGLSPEFDRQLESYALKTGQDVNQLRKVVTGTPQWQRGEGLVDIRGTVSPAAKRAGMFAETFQRGPEMVTATAPRGFGMKEVTPKNLSFPGKLFDRTDDLVITQGYMVPDKPLKGAPNIGIDIASKKGTKFNIYNPSAGSATLVFYDPRGGHAIYKLEDGSYISNMHSSFVPGTENIKTMTYNENGINNVVVGPGQVLFKAGNVAGGPYVSTGTHASIEFILPGTDILKYKFKPVGRVDPTSFIRGQIGGAKSDWYKGIGGPKPDIRSKPVKGKVEYGLDKPYKKEMVEPAKIGAAPAFTTTQYPAVFGNFLDKIVETGLPKTLAEQALFSIPVMRPYYPLYREALKQNVITSPGEFFFGTSPTQTTTTPPPTTTVTDALSKLTEADRAAYQQQFGNTYLEALRSVQGTVTNDYNPRTNPADKLLANRGLTGKGLTQQELEVLREAAIAGEAATRTNLYTAGAAARSENLAAPSRLREYIGRGRRDLSGTQAGRDLARSFSEASALRQNEIANQLAAAQQGVEGSLLSNVSAVRGSAAQREAARQAAEQQAALLDVQRKQALGTEADYLKAQKATRDAEISTLIDSISDLATKIETWSKKLTTGTVEQQATARSIYNLYKQNLEAVKTRLRELGRLVE